MQGLELAAAAVAAEGKGDDLLAAGSNDVALPLGETDVAVAAPLQKLLQQAMSSDSDVGPSGDVTVAASAPVDAPAAAAVEGEEAGEEAEQKQSSSSAQDAWAWRAHMSALSRPSTPPRCRSMRG